ncbi:MAG TPA: 5-formyltetrahydrofolate cyclo-ligase [Paraburkholderia sp.]|uniref:5-formyltetrahydrofolate cyclo-ligase n=1 Tax=Paraburkholderia sp. TaxID=1926495 RepID=UPI002DEC4096|nr:5-formyltetrahydrofolate cyclo-ligase [Paraburkholderia sp.]
MNPSIARNPLAEAKKTWRLRLREARLAASSDGIANAALTANLDALIAHLAPPYAPRSIGFYWPLPGEFDAREWIATWLAADASRRAALPAIPERHTPLQFYSWTPGAALREGHHGIPEPAAQDAHSAALPDLLLVPCVGFDRAGYRLGYGGGYYDRTLAAWPAAEPPLTVGLAYEACRIDDGVLEPEAHDLPLDAVVTDAGAHLAGRLRER